MELHPLASEVLQARDEHGVFQSNRLCHGIAQQSPKKCVQWAIGLVASHIAEANQNNDLRQAVDEIRDATESGSSESLSTLDQLASNSWYSTDHDPYLSRAVARLAWATICLICHEKSLSFKSAFVNLQVGEGHRIAIREMANQSAMAIDLTVSRLEDGPSQVATSFSREMNLLP